MTADGFQVSAVRSVVIVAGGFRGCAPIVELLGGKNYGAVGFVVAGHGMVAEAPLLRLAADARAKGCSLADAAKVVAPEFQQLAGRKAKGVLARTVEGWRKEVSSGRVKNFVAREVLNVGLEIVSSKSAGDCEQLAADFFAEASKFGGFSPAY